MKLFKKLASIYSGSHEEEPMRRYIRRWLISCIPSAKVTEDKLGNIYITKGEADTYPCVVAHLDQVQTPYPPDYKVVETQDIIFGYSPSLRSECGLGADDKCGIWIALKMLKKHPAIKVAFFIGEEIGCVGSSSADMDFFSDVRFVIEPDRRGACDLITDICGMSLCSKEFLADSEYEKFGYQPASGMMTDVQALKENGLGVSCINMSCGYYDPHTEREFVAIVDMINALRLVDHIITNCTKVYAHEAEYSYRYNREFLGYDDTDYDWYGKWSKGGRKSKKRNSSSNSAKNVDKWWLNDKKTDNEDYSTTYINESKDETDDVADDAVDSMEEYEEWSKQYDDAYDFIAAELASNSDFSAEDFLSSYGDCLDRLTVSDIKVIVARLQSR